MTDLGQLWVWRDPGLAWSLEWYAAFAANRMPAKFRVAAASRGIAARRSAGPRSLGGVGTTDARVPVVLGRCARRGRRLTPPAANGSLLDLCRELAWRMLGHCNFCRWDCHIDRRTGTKLGACKLVDTDHGDL
jgi:putative pyruvate formate lyase activating enzyme